MKKKIIGYKVISQQRLNAEDPKYYSMEEKVNELIKEGYIPFGPLVVDVGTNR